MAIERVDYQHLSAVNIQNGVGEFNMEVTYPITPQSFLTPREYRLNRRQLQTPPPNDTLRTFIVGSFTALYDPALRRLPDWYIGFIEAIHMFYDRNPRIQSYSCFRRERYGLKGITSEQATVLDRLALDTSHFLTVLPGSSNSSGTWKELSYATKSGTELLCIFREDQPETQFQKQIKGVALDNGAKSPLTFITYRASDDLFMQLSQVCGELLNQRFDEVG